MEEILASIRRIISDDQALPSRLVAEPAAPTPAAPEAEPPDVAASAKAHEEADGWTETIARPPIRLRPPRLFRARRPPRRRRGAALISGSGQGFPAAVAAGAGRRRRPMSRSRGAAAGTEPQILRGTAANPPPHRAQPAACALGRCRRGARFSGDGCDGVAGVQHADRQPISAIERCDGRNGARDAAAHAQGLARRQSAELVERLVRAEIERVARGGR